MAAMLRDAVAGGDYASSSEVVRDALRLWKLRRDSQVEAVEELRRAIEVGLAQLDHGESIAADDVFNDITRRLESRRIARQ
jgi:antitoxin ParD1/3/4